MQFVKKIFLLIFFISISSSYLYSQSNFYRKSPFNEDPFEESQQRLNKNVFAEDIKKNYIEAEFIKNNYIEAEFIKNNYIDQLYVINLINYDYENGYIELPTGEQIPFAKILKNIGVAEGVMFIAAVALSSIPGTQPFTAFIVSWHMQALVGAAFNAAVTGVVSYVQTENISETTNNILIGASEGYKWGAIFAVGSSTIQTAKVATAAKSNKGVKTLSFSEIASPNDYSKLKPQKIVGETKQDYVYRVLRPEENPKLGLFAKNPERNITIEGHVLNGSKPNFHGSQYISTTTDYNVAKAYAQQDGSRIVKIDLNKVPDTVNIYDLSTKVGQDVYLKGITSKNWANSSKEVLLEGTIPPEALTIIK